MRVLRERRESDKRQKTEVEGMLMAEEYNVL